MLPREKFLLRGINSISDVELIEILVGSGIKGADFKKISKSVLKVVKEKVSKEEHISVKDLQQVHGVGQILAMKIVSGIELGRRVYGLFDREVVRVTSCKEAYEIFKDMKDLKRERVDIVCLNSRFEYVVREIVAIGGLNCANILPRDILYPAIVNNCAFVLMAHNHPSGDSTPSQEDIALTKNLNQALELVGIQLLDHIVVSKGNYSSVPL
ncbi:MAG: DNA repair protein RadC [Candidatus Dojkabacteria bacterium]|jgi:DNA repair protein RadC|nr:DNA repair protein RadC [Candidatus Dojkabacteria bacterium]